MYAILIHIAGYLLINSLMPSWVDEAGWIILSAWYGAFVAVDLIAMTVCRSRRILAAMAASCAWSAAIMLEVCMGSDLLQSHDWFAQYAITIGICAAAIIDLLSWRNRAGIKHGN